MDKKVLKLLGYDEVLNYLSSFALSEEGKSRCKQLEPQSKIEEIEKQFSLLKEAISHKELILKIIKPFLNLKGVFLFIKQGKVLDEEGLWGIKDLLGKARECKECLQRDLPEGSFLKEIVKQITWPKKTWQALNRCLTKDGEIRGESTPELYEIRKEISSIQKLCTKKITKFVDDEKIDYLQDEYFTISSDRYVLALKSNFKGRLEGIIHDYSRSGDTCYFEPLFLVELNNKLQRLRQKEKEEIRKILEYLTSLIKEEIQEIEDIYSWMVELDVLRAKVVMALETKGNIVDIRENGTLNLKGARNPLLLVTKQNVQPVDIELKTNQKALIITGGNSGGKTVALKTLGLVTFMTLAGLPAPVEENSSIPLWRNIYAVLGDEQDITKHLSTFTAQVAYIRDIWESLSKDSLVILDEFGSGTDPTEGSALAQALIDCLIQKGVFVAVATHFPALKLYALSKENVRSAAVLFHPTTKAPLYKIGYDQVGASLALDVAAEYGMPKEILNKAKSYLNIERKDLDIVFDRLNQLAVEREKEIQRLKVEREEVKEYKEKLKKKYEKEINFIIEDVRSFIKNLRDEIKKGRLERKGALKEAQRKYKELLNTLSSKISSTTEDLPKTLDWKEVNVGMKIYYIPWGKKAIVEDKDEREKKLRIAVGNVRVWCDLQEINPLDQEKSDDISFKENVNEEEFLGWSLDIRGLRVDEAISKVSKFLDSAIYKGKHQVEIIHGRGEGILKKAVHEYLKDLSHIFTYCFAPEDRGGDGVTIVNIKEQ